MKRSPVALAIVFVVGAVMSVGALVIGLPAKTQGVDNLTNAFRPAFRPNALAQTRKDMDTVKAMAAELDTKAIPALAAQLHTSPNQLGTILPRFQALVSGVEKNTTNFRLADSIPTASTPTTLLHWLFVLPALVLVTTGGAGLLAGRRAGARTATVDGALLGPAATTR